MWKEIGIGWDNSDITFGAGISGSLGINFYTSKSGMFHNEKPLKRRISFKINLIFLSIDIDLNCSHPYRKEDLHIDIPEGDRLIGSINCYYIKDVLKDWKKKIKKQSKKRYNNIWKAMLIK